MRASIIGLYAALIYLIDQKRFFDNDIFCVEQQIVRSGNYG